MPSRGPTTKLCAAALFAGVIASASIVIPAFGQDGGGGDGAKRPNFLFVVTDDQTLAQMKALPKTERFIGKKGTTFTQAVVTTPQCCPSRASMLTGQYAHNHGILSNKHGYPAFVEPGNVLPVWLSRAGYQTAHLGKFLNGYEKAVGPITEVAPGWDEWATLLKPRRYLDYELQVNGESVRYGEEKGDYLTNVLNERAGDLIREMASADDPFYIQLDQYAPHTGSGDPSGECGKFTGTEAGAFRRYEDTALPEEENYNEKRIEDKPVFVARQNRLSKSAKERIELSYRCALASLETVDEGVKELVGELEQAGVLDTTVIVFTSDNGFFYGEHRIPGSKTLPYEETIRVPLLMRLPESLQGSERVREVDEQVANIDIAPTILDLAGAEPCTGEVCRTMDGRSLVPLLEGRGSSFADRGVVIELTQGKDKVKPTLSCSYLGVRTTRSIYVEHTSVPRPSDRACEDALEVESYDLRSDPFELENLGENADLAARLAALHACSGIASRDPAPESGAYCD
ncbi:MAG: sulfatase family protein [Solirubrobacterales bacterium]